MFRRILGLIASGGIAELFILIAAGSRFGAMPVFAMLILSAAAGFALIRHFGLQSLAKLQADLQDLGRPQAPLSRNIFGTIAGLLLILPGFLSDTAGIALLFPATQRFILKRLLTAKGDGFAHSGKYERIIIIDGEATEIDRDLPRRSAPPGQSP